MTLKCSGLGGGGRLRGRRRCLEAARRWRLLVVSSELQLKRKTYRTIGGGAMARSEIDSYMLLDPREEKAKLLYLTRLESECDVP